LEKRTELEKKLAERLLVVVVVVLKAPAAAAAAKQHILRLTSEVGPGRPGRQIPEHPVAIRAAELIASVGPRGVPEPMV
jgi:hypothetical protein